MPSNSNPGGPGGHRRRIQSNKSHGRASGRASVPPSSGGGKKKGACDMWLPVAAVATIFYAVPRMAWEDWRKRRATHTR